MILLAVAFGFFLGYTINKLFDKVVFVRAKTKQIKGGDFKWQK